MNRASLLRSRYYLKPHIERMREKGLSECKIGDLLGVARHSLSDAVKKGEISNNNVIDGILGTVDLEYNRVAAELDCMKILVRRGWQAGQADPKCIFDIFAAKAGTMITVQVKSSTVLNKRGWPQFKTSRLKFNTKECKKTKYNVGDFDYWFFYYKNGDSWFIPFSEMESTSMISAEGLDKYYTGNAFEMV